MAPPTTHPYIVTSPGQARHLVTSVLAAAGAEVCECAALLTSELVTNALSHAHMSRVPISVYPAMPHVRVEVRDDDGSSLPRVEEGQRLVGGRGVRIVDRLASRWGVDVVPDDGKVVWFEID